MEVSVTPCPSNAGAVVVERYAGPACATFYSLMAQRVNVLRRMTTLLTEAAHATP